MSGPLQSGALTITDYSTCRERPLPSRHGITRMRFGQPEQAKSTLIIQIVQVLLTPELMPRHRSYSERVEQTNTGLLRTMLESGSTFVNLNAAMCQWWTNMGR